MKKIWKIGIIGLGGIAHMAHFNAFKQQKDCRLTAGCDIDPLKFKLAEKESGIRKFYLDYNEMFREEKLDAVVICTPNGTHKAISMKALKAGISVLCEKPLCSTAKDAEAVNKAAASSNAKFMIGQCFRFREQTVKILHLINNKCLGEVYYCKASYIRQRGIPGFGTWFTDEKRAGGGVILDLGVHLIDYIWFLLGKPEFKSVSAFKYGGIGKRIARGEKAGFKGSKYPSTYRGPDNNVFDVEEMGSVFIRFANGIVFHLEISWAMNVNEDISNGVIFGDKGSISLSPLIYTHENGGSMLSEELPSAPVPSHNNQARAFLDLLHGKIDNPVPASDGLKIMRVLDAIYESAKKGKEIILKK